jgi:hypothetical protein
MDPGLLREIVRLSAVVLPMAPAFAVIWLGVRCLETILGDHSLGWRSAVSLLLRALPGVLLCAFGCVLLWRLVSTIIALPPP